MEKFNAVLELMLKITLIVMILIYMKKRKDL